MPSKLYGYTLFAIGGFLLLSIFGEIAPIGETGVYTLSSLGMLTIVVSIGYIGIQYYTEDSMSK